jgi:predicted transposase YdaD
VGLGSVEGLGFGESTQRGPQRGAQRGQQRGQQRGPQRVTFLIKNIC